MTKEKAQIIIGNIPIKPEVLDDCYDITEYQEAKAMAIEALAQESITWIVGNDNCQIAVRNMPVDKMLKICAIIGEEEQQPCEDAVSRQALIDKATSWDAHFADSERVVSLADIKSLPSVQPQPKTGEWIKKIEPYEAEPFILWECSKCHMKVRGSMKSDYCPNCGVDMRGGEE